MKGLEALKIILEHIAYIYKENKNIKLYGQIKVLLEECADTIEQELKEKQTLQNNFDNLRKCYEMTLEKYKKELKAKERLESKYLKLHLAIKDLTKEEIEEVIRVHKSVIPMPSKYEAKIISKLERLKEVLK